MLELIDKGGLISWILIALSIITVAIIIFKIMHFVRIRINHSRPVKKALKSIANDESEIAINILSKAKNPIAKTMLYSMEKIEEEGPDKAEPAIKEQGNLTLARLRRLLPWLDTIAHVAPLLGLLGTVVGMIKAFRELEAAGVQVDVTMLAGGIWEALLTTAIGLVISMIALVAVNAFEGQIEKARQTMSIAISKLLELNK